MPGRPSIPPGTCFRTLLVGYFEGLESQRGIACRCADSLSLHEFLNLAAHEPTTLEADAAMKSILRRDTGEDWKKYVTRLMQEEGAV
jgi:transposase